MMPFLVLLRVLGEDASDRQLQNIYTLF